MRETTLAKLMRFSDRLAGLSFPQEKAAVNAVTEKVVTTLKNGETVSVIGIGNFEVKQLKEAQN